MKTTQIVETKTTTSNGQTKASKEEWANIRRGWRETAAHSKRVAWRYVRGSTLPRSVGAGRVLVHNSIAHNVDTACGWNGFRAWTRLPGRDLVKCSCGWAGLPHYRMRAVKSCRRPAS